MENEWANDTTPTSGRGDILSCLVYTARSRDTCLLAYSSIMFDTSFPRVTARPTMVSDTNGRLMSIHRVRRMSTVEFSQFLGTVLWFLARQKICIFYYGKIMNSNHY